MGHFGFRDFFQELCLKVVLTFVYVCLIPLQFLFTYLRCTRFLDKKCLKAM